MTHIIVEVPPTYNDLLVALGTWNHNVEARAVPAKNSALTPWMLTGPRQGLGTISSLRAIGGTLSKGPRYLKEALWGPLRYFEGP